MLSLLHKIGVAPHQNGVLFMSELEQEKNYFKFDT
jgi:hypothetical protein